jgi:hypothetical protein
VARSAGGDPISQNRAYIINIPRQNRISKKDNAKPKRRQTNEQVILVIGNFFS